MSSRSYGSSSMSVQFKAEFPKESGSIAEQRAAQIMSGIFYCIFTV